MQLDNQQLSDLIEIAVRKVIGEAPVQLPTPEPERPLTIGEAANYLSLSIPTVYTLISKGELPVKKRSKRCYFFASDLNNYLKEGSKKTNKEIAAEAKTHLEELEQKKVLTAKSKKR